MTPTELARKSLNSKLDIKAAAPAYLPLLVEVKELLFVGGVQLKFHSMAVEIVGVSEGRLSKLSHVGVVDTADIGTGCGVCVAQG